MIYGQTPGSAYKEYRYEGAEGGGRPGEAGGAGRDTQGRVVDADYRER